MLEGGWAVNKRSVVVFYSTALHRRIGSDVLAGRSGHPPLLWYVQWMLCTQSALCSHLKTLLTHTHTHTHTYLSGLGWWSQHSHWVGCFMGQNISTGGCLAAGLTQWWRFISDLTDRWGLCGFREVRCLQGKWNFDLDAQFEAFFSDGDQKSHSFLVFLFVLCVNHSVSFKWWLYLWWCLSCSELLLLN